MSRKVFLIFAMIVFGFMVSHATFADAKQKDSKNLDFTKKFRWTCQSGWQSATYLHKRVVNWAKRVESLSGGRIKIAVHPGGAVVKPTEIYDAVRTGAIEVGHSWAGFWMASNMTACAVGNTPAFNDFSGYTTYLLSDGGGFQFLEKMRKGEVKTIFGGMDTWESGMWSNKELNKLEDFNGMKYRGPIHNCDMMQTLGANSIWIPPGEIVSSLRTGVIDAVEYSTPDGDYSIGLHEVSKYYYFPSIHQYVLNLDLIINNKVWDSLPDDLKAIVVGAAHQDIVDDYPNMMMADMDAMDKIKEYGTKIRRFSPEIQNYMANTYVDLYENKYAPNAKANPGFKEAWEHQKRFLARYLPYRDLNKVEWIDKDNFYKMIRAKKYEEQK